MARSCGRAAVKLGGSLITVKDKPYTVNRQALAEASRQLAAFASTGGSLVIVHGGGSFGHAEVERQARLHGKPLPPATAAPIQAAMLTLSTEVARALVEAGVPASVHPAHTICTCCACDYGPLQRSLVEGLVPVTYGDALACRGRVEIVSGDRLVVEAALALNADCVVFAMDKPGVLGPDGAPLGEVSPGTSLQAVDGPKGPDVTGGLEAKLDWAFRAAREGLEVRIVSAGLLLKALRGEPAGTRIVV